MKSRVFMVIAAAVITVSLATGLVLARTNNSSADRASSARYRVHVLVLTMFMGETKPWLANQRLPLMFRVRGAYSPLHCDLAGLCVTTLGEGKSNAGVSVAAILGDRSFDFRDTFFLTAGVAGTPPSAGTLGFAAWARYVVDWDLGYHLIPSTAPDLPYGYRPPAPSRYAAEFHLDAHLAETAYRVTSKVPLADSGEAARARARYPGQAGQKPFVALCDTVSGDDYFIGAALSREAGYIASVETGGRGRYCTAEQEDSAVAAALSRFGYLGRYLNLRTASNFDQPYPGETAEQAIQQSPGYAIATENAYRVALAAARYLMSHRG